MKFYATLLQDFQDCLTGKWGMTEAKLIDRINRVEFQTTEAIEMGKAFHKMTEQSFLLTTVHGEPTWPKEKEPIHNEDGSVDFEFWKFKYSVVSEVMRVRSNGMHEQYCQSTIDTKYGPVILYGYIDTQFPLLTIDVKTTKNYRDLSYFDAWQWRTYLYCTKSPEFLYCITDFENVYYENYVNYPELENDLRNHCEKLCEFLDENRLKISNEKIFQN